MVKRLVLLARARGLDGEAMAREAGIDEGLLRDPDGRIDVAKSDDFVEAIATRCGVAGLGAELAAIQEPTTYDAAGQTTASLNPLGESTATLYDAAGSGTLDR